MTTYTIELTNDETARVENAERLGIDVSGLMRSIVSALPAANIHAPHTNGAAKNGAIITDAPTENEYQRLVRIQLEEFARATPEEREAADREFQDFMDSMNAERDLVGAGRLY